MKSFASLVTVVVVFLLLAGTTEAETISVTLHATDPQTVTFSDGSGEYFTDWRIWMNDSGSPAIADEKAGATNIGDVSVSQATQDGGDGANPHSFNYTDADTHDGSGATDFSEAIKLCGTATTPASASFSTSDIGPAGTLYVYSGGYETANELEAVIGSESVSVNRQYQGGDEYCDWWEIEYSGVTDPQATLDITITTTSGHHDVQLYAAALDVVPEPSMLVGLVGVALTGTLGYFWRRRYSARR